MTGEVPPPADGARPPGYAPPAMAARLALLASLVALAALGCGEPQLPDWRAPLGRDHALTGVIVETSTGVRLTPGELVERLARARWVILGEKHDHPDHHLLQAWVIAALAARGQQRATVFEMLDLDQEEALDGLGDDVDALARAVDWESSGWPEWALYRPVFAAAFDAGWPVVPGAPPERLLAIVRRHGLRGIKRDLPEHLPTFDARVRREEAAEIAEAHCQLVTPGAIRAVVEIQRARDAIMARSLQRRAEADGAVLIAGTGHARRDRGVPAYLRPPTDVAVLALMEVSSSDDGVEAIADAHARAFDYVWLTPRIPDDEDPCEHLRERMENLSSGGGSTPERPAAGREATPPAQRAPAPSGR